MQLKDPSIFIGKQSKQIISFGSGQPDLPPPKSVIDKVDIRKDLRYGLIQGERNLRQAVAKQWKDSSPDNVVITNGASEALDLVFRSIPNGKVLVPKPYYYSYPPILKYAGMTPKYVDTSNNEGKIDFAAFEKKVHGCKAVLINSPSNPTGRVEKIKTAKAIVKMCKDLGIYVVSDEVYRDLNYQREFYQIRGNHVVTINSFSKTYCMCGARVGYVWSGSKPLVNEMIAMKTHTSMNTNLISQDMALEATKTPKKFVQKQLAIWKSRRDLIYEGLSDLGLELWKPEGAFYVLPKVKNPKKFVADMYKKHKVITYLGDWFGAPDRVRLSYALDSTLIEKGLKKIKKYLG